jgi:hypothetical protein
MQAAHCKDCAELGVSPTSDRATEIVISKIIDLCMSGGGCDPDRLSEMAVAYFCVGQSGARGDV